MQRSYPPKPDRSDPATAQPPALGSRTLHAAAWTTSRCIPSWTLLRQSAMQSRVWEPATPEALRFLIAARTEARLQPSRWALSLAVPPLGCWYFSAASSTDVAATSHLVGAAHGWPRRRQRKTSTRRTTASWSSRPLSPRRHGSDRRGQDLDLPFLFRPWLGSATMLRDGRRSCACNSSTAHTRGASRVRREGAPPTSSLPQWCRPLRSRLPTMGCARDGGRAASPSTGLDSTPSSPTVSSRPPRRRPRTASSTKGRAVHR